MKYKAYSYDKKISLQKFLSFSFSMLMRRDLETSKIRHFIIHFYLCLIVKKSKDLHSFSKGFRRSRVEALG